MLWIYFITTNPCSVWVRFLKKLLEDCDEFRLVPVSFARAEKGIPDYAFLVLLDTFDCRQTNKKLRSLVRPLTARRLLVVPFVPPHANIQLLDVLAKAGVLNIIEHGYEPDETEKVPVLYDLLVASAQHVQSLKARSATTTTLRKRVK